MLFCLFMFRLITLKHINSLTSIDMFSCLACRSVTHQTSVREVPSSIPGFGNAFYVCICVLLFMWFYFSVQKHNKHDFAIPFAIYTLLPITRVS